MKKQLIALSLALAVLTTTVLAAPSPWVTAEVDTVPTGDWDYQAPITCQGFCDLAQTLYPDMTMLHLDQWLFRWRTNQDDDLDADEPLTREQVAVALYELSKELDMELLYTTPNYTDTGDISSHAQYAVGVLQTANIINGYTDGRFAPQGACTVEQTMALLSRLAHSTSTVELYHRNGIETAIPLDIAHQLLINPHDLGENQLISVYEAQSYEESKADFGTAYGAGFLFGLEKYTQAEYEEYLCYDMAGFSVFAKDDIYYYVKQVATDVQYYRSDTDAYTEESLEEWVSLLYAVDVIVEDVIYRNGLTPYSDRVDREKDYTYDGNHMTVRYNPYGSGEQCYTLLLSQPATQGADGIWCVERFEDIYGNVYLWFPVGEEGVDVAAEDYYAQIQASCDAELDTDWLDPMTVAQDFANTWFHDVPETATFEIDERLSL